MAKAKGAMTGSDLEGSPMQNFFRGKSVFITGASGFLGKVVLEKIVRSCHGVEKVYCLIRAKDGEAPQQRLKKVFEAPVSIIPLVILRVRPRARFTGVRTFRPHQTILLVYVDDFLFYCST